MKLRQTIFSCASLFAILLISGIAWGHNNTNQYGYIRVDSEVPIVISTRCYDGDGDSTNSWKRTPYNQFRSCHGAYMRIDAIGLDHNHVIGRYWRYTYGCGDKGLYLTLKNKDGRDGEHRVYSRCK